MQSGNTYWANIVEQKDMTHELTAKPMQGKKQVWFKNLWEHTVNEIHNLFTAPKEYQFAHCVAEDFRMDTGKTGGVAKQVADERVIFHLVTKPLSYLKPTYQTLRINLKAIRDAINRNHKLPMSAIGCGLDGLRYVKSVMKYFPKKNVAWRYFIRRDRIPNAHGQHKEQL